MLHHYRPSILLALVLSLLVFSEAQRERSTSFDYYALVLRWSPESSAFTIHGLWPESKDGSYPQYCSSKEFSTSEISDLTHTLNDVWLSADGDNSGLWEHEWDKHGTCSNLEIQTYFSRSIDLQAHYNIRAALQNSGIAPGYSSRYTKSTITRAIKSTLGKTPALRCVNSALSEMALCVDKQNFKLINCPSSIGSYFTCPTQFTFE
eukprot:Phypoly_transcript_15839.p1 GENE.Phypoly_transcript_15839~~Phypoly_transcript_15839.p1  ORF type:complete len:206 (+),score=19.88 Phypoly_transcript_15839:234-851(+)